MNRKTALSILGAMSTSVTFFGRDAAASRAGCVLTPDLEMGPFFVDRQANRSDLRSGTHDRYVTQAVPLSLTLRIARVKSAGECTALPGARVDVWHADANGVYSDEAVLQTSGQRYLRGYQITDRTGTVRFQTVYPGWYPGRTVHIHVMIRTFSPSGAPATQYTTQLYFDDSLTDRIMARAPYDTRGARTMANAQDSLYSRSTQLALLARDAGYATSFSIGVKM
jgi:protocatechuate 3,4-dioxygenase beta subunit